MFDPPKKIPVKSVGGMMWAIEPRLWNSAKPTVSALMRMISSAQGY